MKSPTPDQTEETPFAPVASSSASEPQAEEPQGPDGSDAGAQTNNVFASGDWQAIFDPQ